MALLPQAWRDTARAMSQENVEVVRASYEAVTRGNFEDSLSAYSEDTEWDDTRVRPDGGIQRGREAVGDRARTWAGTFSDMGMLLELLGGG